MCVGGWGRGGTSDSSLKYQCTLRALRANRVCVLKKKWNIKIDGNPHGKDMKRSLVPVIQSHLLYFHSYKQELLFPHCTLFLTTLPLCVSVFQMPPVDLAAPMQSPPGFHSPIMVSPTSLHPGVHADLAHLMPGEQTDQQKTRLDYWRAHNIKY